MPLRAVVFDFDGVIADTERLHLRAFQEVLDEEGVPLTAAEYAARYLGREDADVFRDLYRDRDRPLDLGRLRALLARKSARYDELAGAGNVLIDGVASRVTEWSQLVPLAIASGARRIEVESVLGAAGVLPCFAAVVTAEDVDRGKPAPDPYLAAIDRLAALRVNQRTPGTAGWRLERGSV
ncbi:MAG: HAD family phosphatase, partial [Acidobacteria bacterium]